MGSPAGHDDMAYLYKGPSGVKQFFLCSLFPGKEKTLTFNIIIKTEYDYERSI